MLGGEDQFCYTKDPPEETLEALNVNTSDSDPQVTPIIRYNAVDHYIELEIEQYCFWILLLKLKNY